MSFVSCNKEISKSQTDSEKLLVLAKIYGYTKYFHPSDEASSIDWDSFGILASQRVLESEDLKGTLKELFLPIAPQMKIDRFEQESQASATIDIVDIDTLQHVFWQHIGHGQGSVGAIYKSARLNKAARVLSNSTNDYSGIRKDITIDDSPKREER